MTIGRKMKLDSYLTLLTKISSRWIKELNIRLNTIKFPKAIIVKKLLDIGISNAFSDMTSKAKQQKQR